MSSICHMSDFDIYIPTQRQLSKRIKPPKKWCFAVKSQQKSAIFLSTANFVHFFATNDKKLAAAWYSAVQGWRSWYLVNVMGKGHSKSDKTDANATAASYQGPASGAGLQRPRHQNKPSTDSTPYQIGSRFQSWINFNQTSHPKIAWLLRSLRSRRPTPKRGMRADVSTWEGPHHHFPKAY
jgi:hypothetical protein